MAAPVKQGVQGGDSMENEAEGPKFDLWLPPVPLWLLSGHPERSSPPQRRNTPGLPPQRRNPNAAGAAKFPSAWGAAPKQPIEVTL